MARKPLQWPLDVRSGSFVVRVYKTEIGGQARHQLRWEENGKVQRKTITDEATAIQVAGITAERISSGEAGAITLNPLASAAYRHMEKLCGETPIDQAVKEWAEARRRLGGVNLLQAVDDYNTRHQGESIAVNLAIERFVASLTAKDVSEVYLTRYSDRLDKLKAVFGSRSIRAITEGEIRAFIEEQGGAPRTRKNVRDGIVTLWRWARREGYLPRDIQTEAERIEAPKIRRKSKIGIFTPQEMADLLAAASPHMTPVIAICGFAGIRSQGEISRLRWEHFRWSQGMIDVSTVSDDEDDEDEAVSKTGARRLVPIFPNLRAWLADFEKATGPIIDLAAPDKGFARTAKKAKVAWKHNGLRHSFGSYRVAQTKSIDQTSLEMGNSPQMVRKHYLEAVHEDEAKAWFSIMPPV